MELVREIFGATSNERVNDYLTPAPGTILDDISFCVHDIIQIVFMLADGGLALTNDTPTHQFTGPVQAAVTMSKWLFFFDETGSIVYVCIRKTRRSSLSTVPFSVPKGARRGISSVCDFQAMRA